MDITRMLCPPKYCFSGNPVIVEYNSTSSDDMILLIKVNGSPVISLTATPYLSGQTYPYSGIFDIADILQTFFKDIFIPEGNIISPMADFMLTYELSEPDVASPFFTGYAFRGGITGKNYERLANLKLNMFTYRLREHSNQFLFTTRTNSKHLRLRQSELYPFIFIHPGRSVSFVTSNARTLTPEIFPADTICTLDVAAIRKMFFDLYRELPSYFAVMVDGKFSFDITLVPGQISEEKNFLLFRNSIGGYEKIEVTGKATNEVKFMDEDSWKSSNEVNILEDNRNRLITTESLNVETGYKSPDELSFVLDMVKSDEIFFIDPSDPNNTPQRCKVTAENFKYPRKSISPQSVSLKISFLQEDEFESPGIVFDSKESIFENITRPGSPEWNGDGFIYGNDYMLYGE